jgi:hypothetical protein
MTIGELLKKPTKIILENNISNDVIKPNDSITRVIDMILKISEPGPEFLVVYTDEVDSDYPVKAVVTNREISSFVEEILSNKVSTTIKDLKLESKFPLKYFVYEDDLIEKVFKLFQADLTDVVVVLNKDDKYIGKVRRSSFIEKTKILTS